MDGGIAKQRARWSKPIVTRDAQVLVDTKENKLAFDIWMRDELAGGAGWFDFTDCVAGVTKKARFVAGKVTWSAPDGIWVAACQLETIG